MTDMTKRRNELADKRSRRQCSSGNPDLDRAISWYLKIGFEDGFDAGVAEMQAQVDGLMKSNKEMSDLIYSDDGYIASQDSLIIERDTLKQQLEIAVKALEFVRTDYGGYAKEVEEGSEASYIWEHVSSRAKTEARQALTQIKELQGSPSVAADREELK